MHCGLSTFENHRHDHTRYVRFRCKGWKCPHCGPRRLKKLAKDAYLGRPTAFLTLTVNPAAFKCRASAAQALVVSFRRLREEIQRTRKLGPIPFIAVFEATEAGWPHLHILWRGPYVPQKWISNFMARRHDSPIVDIRKIRNRKSAAGYVAKYVGKAPHQFGGCKRYWRNSAYIVARTADKARPGQWKMLRTSLEHISDSLVCDMTPDEFSHVEAITVYPTGPPEFHCR